MNAGTDQVFVMKPDDDPTATLPDEFQTELDLNAQAGTEIFAGVGIPFTSACVYGGATLTTEGQLFPEGGIEREYVNGKVYIKVTLMDVPVDDHHFNLLPPISTYFYINKKCRKKPLNISFFRHL